MTTQQIPLPKTDEAIDRLRYFRITSFFARIILSVVFWDLFVARAWLIGPSVKASRPERFRKMSRRFRYLAVDMGGVLIKLGQFLSARVDILPPEIILELVGLQDEVPPIPHNEIDAVIRSELGNPDQIFTRVEKEPLAAASLGQTHRAWLRLPDRDVEDAVVIKVQRPRIERLVRTDIAALRIVARWVMRYRPIRSRANVPALMEEFGEVLWEELDYKLELTNAGQFASMFESYDGLHIPRFYDQYCTGRVLVIENVEGLKITDVEQINALGIDSKQVADRLLDVYYIQVFDNAFFHADPHPGNLFLRARPDKPHAEDESTPFDLIFIDFGMMGRIPEETNQLLRTMLVSMTTRNARKLTETYQKLGFFLPGADLERITEAQERILDQIWDRNLLDLAQPDMAEVADIGSEFNDIIFDFPFQIPQNFIYLGRAVGILSGLSALLNPTINPFGYIEDYGKRILGSQQLGAIGRDAVVETFREYAGIPAQLKRVLDDAEKGKLKLQFKPDRKTEQQLERLERRSRQLNGSVVSVAMLLAGTILYVSEEPTMGISFWCVAAASHLWSSLRNR